MDLDKEELRKNILNALDIQETVPFDAKIREYTELDSLAILSVLSMVDEEYGIMLNPEQLGNAETLNDIINLMSEQE